jgi:hypothetical protein
MAADAGFAGIGSRPLESQATRSKSSCFGGAEADFDREWS